MSTTSRKAEYIINRRLLRIEYGSITDQQTQVWVSSDDDHLSMSGGVSKAILKAAGDGIFKQNRAVVPLEVGRVAVTGGGNAKGVVYIFHPSIIKKNAKGVVKGTAIASVTRRCLELANDLQMKSIAFPAIGTGNANVPFKVVAEAMIDTVSQYLMGNSTIEEVVISLYASPGDAVNEVNLLYETETKKAAQVQQKSNLGSMLSDLGDVFESNGMNDQVSLFKTISQKLGLTRKKVDDKQDIRVMEDLLRALKVEEVVPNSSGGVTGLAEADTQMLRKQVLTTRLNGLYYLLNVKTGQLNDIEIEAAKSGTAFDKQAGLLKLQNELADLNLQIVQIEKQIADMTPDNNPNRDAVGDPFGPAPTAVLGGKQYLILVAVNEYNGFNNLNNAVKDAKDVAEVLQTSYGFRSDRTIPFFNENATRKKVNDQLRAFYDKNSTQRLGPEDRLLIYFSGHGYYDRDLDQGYWILSDAQKEDNTTYYDNTLLIKSLKALPCRHVVVLADACFSGALLRNADTTSRVFERMEALQSRWAIVSGRLEVVSDGQAGSNSPFASYLLKFLRNPPEKVYLAGDLAQYLKNAVGGNSEQIPDGKPIQNAGDEGGEYVFRKDGATYVPRSNPSAPIVSSGPSRDTAVVTPGPQPIAPSQPTSTNPSDIKKGVKAAIAMGDYALAIQHLMLLPDTHALYNDAILVSGRYHKAQRDKAVTSEQQYDLQMNRIGVSITDLSNRL